MNNQSQYDELWQVYDKYKKIKHIVINADDYIKNTYSAVIIEGYKDVFDLIKEVIEGD